MLHAHIGESSASRSASRDPRRGSAGFARRSEARAPIRDSVSSPFHNLHAIAGLQASRGNQAAVRMLSGQEHRSAGETVAQASLSDGAGPGLPSLMMTPAPMTPMIQRQDAGGMNGGGANGGDIDGGAALTAGGGSWSTADLIAILVDKNSNCLGSSRGTKYSDKCGPVKGPFCQAAGITFVVDFIVDFPDTPRPQPFSLPYVSVYFKLTTSGGATKTEISKNDPNPRYVAAGAPLEPSFGHEFPISTSESANLWVDLHIFDPDTSTSVDYQDNIKFVVTPCT